MNSTETQRGGLEIVHGNILGTAVSAVDMALALDFVALRIAEHRPAYICVVPAHTVMDALADPVLRRIVNSAGLATPDGMAIVWLLRLHGHKQVGRVYGPDLLIEACRFGVAHQWRHFFYGGGEGVADELAARLSGQIPELNVAGTYTPPFRPLEPAKRKEVQSLINDSGADIVWVGLSSPKQEFWMAEHLGKIGAPMMIGVGAAFDFLSGNKPHAPRWIQRSGLEWLFRLSSEPRRLWPRYRQYPKFVLLALAQLNGLKKYPIDD